MANSPAVAGPPAEMAPSRLAVESGGLPRLLGLLGLAGMMTAAMTLLANQIVGPRYFGTQYGVILFAVSLAVTLYGALREGDLTVLRWYGFLGFGLIASSGVLTVAKTGNFSVYGWPGLLVGLCFLICHARREEEPGFLRFVLLSLLGTGAVFSLAGMVGGAVQPEFLLHYGAILALLGLLYLAAYLGQVGTSDGPGYRVARIAGLAGLGFFAFGLVRSILPNVGFTALTPYTVPQGVFLMAFGLLFAAVGIGSYTDNTIVVMARRELAAYFYSPIAYLILVFMVFVGAVNFYLFYQAFFDPRFAEQVPMPVAEPVVGRFLLNLVPAFIIVITVPAVTMRLFAEEKRTGSFEVLMGAPVTDLAVVLSKFAAGLVFFVLLWVPVALYLVPLRIELGQPFDYRPVISFFLALTAVGAGFVAMGLFFSSLTKNQIVAVVLTFAVILFLLLTIFFGDSPRVPETARRVLAKLSFWSMLSGAIQGRLWLRDFVIHGSIAVFWLYLTVKSVESRKWS